MTLDKPVPVSTRKTDKTKIIGRIVAYDGDGFDVRVKADDTQTISWNELDAKALFVVRKSLIGPKDAAGLVELGRELLRMDGGKEWSEKVFAQALKVDPSLKDAVEDIKKEAAEEPRQKESADRPRADGARPVMEAQGEGGAERAAPEMVGRVEEKFWEAQTDEQRAADVRQLKAFAEQTQAALGKRLELNETTFFLFYSDLAPQEAKNWSSLLDRMYTKLADLFAVDRMTNLWRGKALVFVFRTPGDYAKFQARMHQTDAGQSAGMCHTFGDGIVHIAFFRQSDELEFAHVLVHESVHGFLHRYKTPVPVPSWANEGLAEWIANQLVPRPDRQKRVHYAARQFIREHRGVAGFFEGQHIEAWQYPVAEMLTTFMIERNKRGYVAFIDAIKDGAGWEDALKTNYNKTREKLMQEFGAGLGV